MKLIEFIKKFFHFVSSIKATIVLLNIVFFILIFQVIIKSDLFYIVLQTYVQNNFKESKYLTQYIEDLRIANFYGKDKFNEIMSKETVTESDRFWSYNPIKNRDVYSEFEKIKDKNDLEKVINLFIDLDNFYFDLINWKYKYDRENAFYKLKHILEKYRCQIHIIVEKHKIDWHITIVPSIKGLVYETLYYTQTINDKMLVGKNRLEVINNHGNFFLQILVADKCIKQKL